MLALVSCASESTSHAELSTLQAELRAMREENARLARRIDQLENGRAGAPAGGSNALVSNPRDLPTLTVVRLKPKSDPPPKISVAVPVAEPPPEMVAEILEAPSVSASRIQEGGGAGNASLDAEFAEGVAALRTGNVSGGIARLQGFAAQNPRHPKADNALYFVGVGRMAQSDFEAAASAFAKLLSTYPASEEVRDTMLRLAECRARLKNAREARALYTQVVNKYPGSAAANEATQRLALLPP